MLETYLTHYVLNGGWAMLLLVPASIVVVAAIVRAALLVRAEEVVAKGNESALQRVLAVVDAESPEEKMREAVEDETLRIYAQFQPLLIAYVAAPMIGVIGSITMLMNANLELARGGAAEAMATYAERALIPSMWGSVIGLVAFIAFAILRWRLYYVERDILMPAVRQHVSALKKTPIIRVRDEQVHQ